MTTMVSKQQHSEVWILLMTRLALMVDFLASKSGRTNSQLGDKNNHSFSKEASLHPKHLGHFILTFLNFRNYCQPHVEHQNIWTSGLSFPSLSILKTISYLILLKCQIKLITAGKENWKIHGMVKKIRYPKTFTALPT